MEMDVRYLFAKDVKYIPYKSKINGSIWNEKEQEEVIKELQSIVNSSKTYKIAAKRVNDAINKNPLYKELIQNHYQNDFESMWGDDVENPYWTVDKRYDYKINYDENASFIDKEALAGSQVFGKQERNKLRDEDQFSKTEARFERVKKNIDNNNSKRVIRRRQDYIKRDRNGKIKVNKMGVPKTYGRVTKLGIDILNNLVDTKWAKWLEFIIFRAKYILYGILGLIILTIALIIGSSLAGSAGMLGQSPFLLCSTSDISDIKDDSVSSSNGTNVNMDNPSKEDLAAYAGVSLSDTYGISDEKIESYFLSAGSSVIKRYGLDKSNIHEVTEAVKKYKISPTLFYGYTLNEGGGAGGFINHYGNSTGNAVKDAERDAQYLKQNGDNMSSKPSWVDAGNPVDFVPQDVKDKGNAEFQKLPAGTIGRAYISATAAATWEFYYPEGLQKSHNGVQNYGSPIAGVMKVIKTLGGSPGSSLVSGETTGDCDDVRGGNTSSKEGEINPSDNNKAGKAMKWILSSSNWNSQTDGGLPGIDVDGVFGAQCVDVAMKFAEMVGTKLNSVNGNSIVSSSEGRLKSDGWKIIDNPKPSDLKIGAITQESPNHTEVVVGWDGKEKVKYLTQNPSSPKVVELNVNSNDSSLKGTGGKVTKIAVPPASIFN